MEHLKVLYGGEFPQAKEKVEIRENTLKSYKSLN